MTPEDDGSLNEQSSLHACRTELPNIIFEIGLNPVEFTLYCLYKKIAGDKGACWKTSEKLGESMGISARSIQRAKKSLCQPRPELGNRPLITISHRFCPESGKQLTDLITITDIWPINFQKYFAGGQNEQGGGDKNDRGGVTKTTYKEDPYKKNPYKKKEKQEKEMGVNPQTPHAPSSSSKKIERAPHVFLTNEEHEELASRLGPEKTEAAYKRLSEWKQDTPRSKWKKSDYRSILRWVMDALAEEKNRKEKTQNAADSESNAQYAKRIAENYNVVMAPRKGVKIEVSSQYMEFLFPKSPGSQPICIPLKSYGFKDQVENALRKTGLK